MTFLIIYCFLGRRDLKKGGTIEKISYERRVYESVYIRSLS